MRIRADHQLFHVGHDYFVVDMSSACIDKTQLYSMNEATAFLWEEFHDKEFTPEEMSMRLCEAFEVDAETARRDISQMLETWKVFGMMA